MKKCVLLILLIAMVLNVLLINNVDTAYAAEPEIIWLEKEYDMVDGRFYESLLGVQLDGKHGFIDKTGKEVIPLKYDDSAFFTDGLVKVELKGKSGFIDKIGKIVIPIKYDDANMFNEGLAGVQLKGKWGYIDRSGKEVIPLKYDSISWFKEGLAEVTLDGKYGYIDKTGKQLGEVKYDDTLFFEEGLAKVVLNGKHGYIDKTGKEVIPLKYDEALFFSEGLASVKLNGKYGSIDKVDKEVLPFKYDYAYNFSEGLAAVKLNDNWGYIDKRGKEVIPLKYDYGEDFSQGLSIVELNNKYGYIDKSGKEITPLKYDFVYEFSEGLSMVELDYKHGYIDKLGKEVIPLKYDFASIRFSEGLTVVELDGKYGYIDKTGKEVIPIQYDVANDFSKGLAIIYLGNKIGILKNPLLKQQEVELTLPQEKAMLATPTASKVLVNGKDISFDAYLIEGNNYFKLRDLAFVVNGTKKQFEVKWDGNKNIINLVSNKLYTRAGGEMAKSKGVDKIPTLNKSSIYKDGVELKLIAYGIEGNNYFKLRDIAKAFNIGVTYDNITKVIGIDTSLSYTDDESNKEVKGLILSAEEHRKINIFFSNFSEMWFKDFDSNNYNLEDLIDFAYMNTKINNVPNIKYEDSYYYIDKINVEKTINKYFGLNISHKSVGKFEYRNGRYYIPAADGDNYFGFSQVDKLIDNYDGTYTADISIYEYNDNNHDYDGVPGKYYYPKNTWEKSYDEYKYYGSAVAKVKSAVVDGKNTYQLLDYKVKYTFTLD